MVDNGMDDALNAGLILVVSVFMAFVTYTVGNFFNLGYWNITADPLPEPYNSSEQSTEPTDLAEGDYEYVSSSGDDIIAITPVVVLLVGMLASFLKLRDVASTTNSGF